MAYATLAQLRQYLQQVPPGPDTDSLLSAELDRATDMIRSAIRAQLADPGFEFADYGSASTRIVQGLASTYLSVPAHQPGSISVIERQTAGNPITYAAITDPWVDEDGRLYRPGGWWHDRYRVTGVWGYGPTPEAITELCLEIAVNLWRAKDRGGYTETVGVDGSGGLRVIAGLNTQQSRILTDVIAHYWTPSI